MNDRLEPRMCIPLGSSITIGPGKGALLEVIGETGSITGKQITVPGVDLTKKFGGRRSAER